MIFFLGRMVSFGVENCRKYFVCAKIYLTLLMAKRVSIRYWCRILVSVNSLWVFWAFRFRLDGKALAVKIFVC